MTAPAVKSGQLTGEFSRQLRSFHKFQPAVLSNVIVRLKKCEKKEETIQISDKLHLETDVDVKELV